MWGRDRSERPRPVEAGFGASPAAWPGVTFTWTSRPHQAFLFALLTALLARLRASLGHVVLRSGTAAITWHCGQLAVRFRSEVDVMAAQGPPNSFGGTASNHEISVT